MTSGQSSTEDQSEISSLLDRRSEAIRAKDIKRLMAVFSPRIVYFDVVPPLHYSGADALRGRFLQWFDRWDGAIGQEVSNLHIATSGEVAVAHMLIRASGTLQGGRDVGYWVRATDCCQRSDDEWLITHEHISLPVDLAGGRVVMNLAP